MELKNVYELWDRFDNSDASEMELSMSGVHLKLKKKLFEGVETPNKKSLTVCSESMKSESVSSETDNADLSAVTEVKSPLVGTFYSAAAPGEAPFITVGKEVHKDDVIGIIEAMKLMNEIKAPCDGVVSEILVRDGSMVEFDQILVNLV